MRDSRVYPILGLGLLLLGLLMAWQVRAPRVQRPVPVAPVEVLVAPEPWGVGSSAGVRELHRRPYEGVATVQMLQLEQRSDSWSWRLKLTLVLVVLLFLIWDRGQRRRGALQL